MLQTFTKDHLVLLLYNELSVDERINCLDIVRKDWQLTEAYHELKRIVVSLPRILKSPSSDSIQNILDYSKKSQINALA